MKEQSGKEQSGEENGQASRENAGNQPKTLRVLGCLGFFVVTLILWVVSNNWFVFLLLLVPYYLFGEWLADKVNLERSRWSTAESGFSILRIVFGVIVAVLLFVLGYGVLVAVRWLQKQFMGS